MPTLIVNAHPMGVPGVWQIKLGRKTIAALVQPNLDVSLGILPTAEDVRSAALEASPDCRVTDETPVQWRGKIFEARQ